MEIEIDMYIGVVYLLKMGFPARIVAGHGRHCSCSSNLPASPMQTAQRQDAELLVLSGRLDSASTTTGFSTFSPVLDMTDTSLAAKRVSRSIQPEVVMFLLICTSLGHC